jgi:hypothetical protein
MVQRMHYLTDLAKDGGVLAAGFTPLAFLGQFGTPAVFISLLNILIFGLLRFYDIRTRSRERLEIARLRLELSAGQVAGTTPAI